MTTQTLSKHGIGASEIGAICGLNPFTSPWDVWARKVGEQPEPEKNQAMDWGHRLEPAIRQRYVDDTGALVYVPTESLFHPETPWARATPDGIVVDVTEAHGRVWKHLVQIKNVSYWTGREWEGQPPPYVQLQTQWEMYVASVSRDDVACLIGGNEFRIYTVHRDDKAIVDLVSIATDFWRRVETRTPPEIDNSDACREHFEKRLAKNSNVELVADEEIEDLFNSWRLLSAQQKTAAKEIDRIRNVVRSHMADAQANRVVSRTGIAKLNKNQDLLAPREWTKDVA